MSLVNMNEILRTANRDGYAVGAFNIFNQVMARAVVRACEELSAPVILQTAVTAVKWYGAAEMMDFLKPLAEKASVPVAIHLDHCPDPDFAKACIDAGWSSVMIDASRLQLKDNIAVSREVAEYGHRHHVSVEGEFGVIAGVEDELEISPDSGSLANLDGSIAYVAQTGVDAFAPAIGTAHGMYKGAPKLNYDLLAELHHAVSVPLVLHGGTGLEAHVFERLIHLGISKINVATALKQVFVSSAKAAAAQYTEPLQVDQYIYHELTECVKSFASIFGSAGKA